MGKVVIVPLWSIKLDQREVALIRAPNYEKAKEYFLEQFIEIQEVEEE